MKRKGGLMKTVKKVSELTGISIRTLRYYDEIDLLKPAKVTEAGYRLYDESSLKKLRQIMFFRELEVPLSEIKAIMKDSESDNRKILETQKMMLEMKRNRLNGIIELISDVLKGEDKKIVIEHYGDIEKFKESVAESFKDEKACEHLIKIYGSKEKAVEASLKSTRQSREELDEQRIEMNAVYEQFSVAMAHSDEKLAMKSVKALGESYKNMFRVENPRALLLEVAKDYLNHSKLEEATDKQYGKGVTKYIGSAIYRYYGVENLE